MGLVAGAAYGLVQVRSPAPPLIALIGLLGIFLGEQAVGLAKRHLALVQTSMREEGIVDVLTDERSRPEEYAIRVCGAPRSDPHFLLSPAREVQKART
jgi:XapX domain-containing protein